MLLEWGLVAAIGAALALGQITPSVLGLRRPAFSHFVVASTFLPALAIGLLLPLVLARFVPKMRHGLAGQLQALGRMVPVTRRDRQHWALSSITAGITEELRFRGFLTLYLATLLPTLPAAAIVAIGAALFGLAHWYQGWKGVLGTGVAGAALGALALYSGSLYPGMVLHALMDLRLLAIVWVLETPAH